MRIARLASLAALPLCFAVSACTVTLSSDPAPDPGSGTTASRVADGGTSRDAAVSSPAVCEVGAPLRFDDPAPAGTELLVAWERLDGTYFVERRVTSDTFAVTTGNLAPPTEARVAASVTWLAVARVVAAPSGVVPSGVVDGDTLRQAVVGATFDDALVWSAGAPSNIVEGWAARTKAGFSVWKCRGSGPKSEALVESTCDALRFSVGAAGNGDRFCDWH